MLHPGTEGTHQVKNKKGAGAISCKLQQGCQGGAHNGRTNYHHFIDAFWKADCYRQTHRPAHAVANQGSTDDSQLFHKLVYKADKILYSIRFALFPRFTKPPKVQSISAVVTTEEAHRLLP